MLSGTKEYLCALGMVFKRQFVIIIGGIICLYLLLTLHGFGNQIDVTTLNPSSFSKGMTNLARMFKPANAHGGSSHPVNVLLLTYMRSGSSLTGDILQHSQGAFYVYEPFRNLGHKKEDSFVIKYANGTVRGPPFEFSKEAYNELYSWFTCDISSLPEITLKDGFLKKSIKAQMMLICLNKMQGTLNSSAALSACARQLQGVCESSPFRIIKTIRLLLTDVSHLLEDLPNLKIIHLVRDPRATMFSQSHMGKCSLRHGGRIGCTNKFCLRVENDVLEEERLLKKYPDRIMPVFYEDIARQPILTSKKMYDFIGAKFTPEAQEYVFNITMAGNPNSCAICTVRSNSSEHIDTWKEAMDPSFIKIINERCNYIIQRYGFDEHPVSIDL